MTTTPSGPMMKAAFEIKFLFSTLPRAVTPSTYQTDGLICLGDSVTACSVCENAGIKQHATLKANNKRM
jgi:hypothetical protein